MTCCDAPLIFSDTRDDALGRSQAVSALQWIITGSGLSTPIAVGIYGGWGTGKTSVMKTLEAQIRSADALTLWFDAWLYARQQESLWRALMLRVIEALRSYLEHVSTGSAQCENVVSESKTTDISARAVLEEAETSLYRSFTRKVEGGVKYNWWGALPVAADFAITAVTGGLDRYLLRVASGDDGHGGVASAAINWLKDDNTKEAVKFIEKRVKECYVDHVTSLEQFQGRMRAVLSLFGIGTSKRLYVFIDDLDRCLPDDALAALEAIKIFLDLPGCVFVIGVDRKVLEQGLRLRFRDVQETEEFVRHYIDKIIQLPFQLPPLSRAQIEGYIDRLLESATLKPLACCADLLCIGPSGNPRLIKRLINTLFLVACLDSQGSGGSSGSLYVSDQSRLRLLAKVVTLQVCYEEAWALIAGEVVSLGDVEMFLRGGDIQLSESVKQKIVGMGIDKIFRSEPSFYSLSAEKMHELVTMSRVSSLSSV